MHEHAISRLISLRQALKENAGAGAEEVIHQINEIMFMLLKQGVFMDYVSTATPENVVLSKMIALMNNAQEMGDGAMRDLLREELHCIMSACLSCTLLGSPHTQLPCNAMSMDERMQHMRSSLLLIL